MLCACPQTTPSFPPSNHQHHHPHHRATQTRHVQLYIRYAISCAYLGSRKQWIFIRNTCKRTKFSFSLLCVCVVWFGGVCKARTCALARLYVRGVGAFSRKSFPLFNVYIYIYSRGRACCAAAAAAAAAVIGESKSFSK